MLLAACSTSQTSVLTPTPSTLTYDYVALGDSTPAGFDVDTAYVDYYAEYIESDLGVPVNVLNWARSGQTAHSLLYALQDISDLRDDISEAEIITIWTGWNDLQGLVGQYRSGDCGGLDNLNCIREKVDRLNADIDAIIGEILTLRSLDNTLILIANVGNPFVESWEAVGILDELREPLVEVWVHHIEQAATDYGIVFVDSYSVLNGPNGDEAVPDELSIGVHFSERGHRLLADLHRAAGYGPLEP